MRWEVVGQINDVGGSLVSLGHVEGNWNDRLRNEAVDVACDAETEPELLSAWVERGSESHLLF
jgi:hypothetical protein